jgi:hypothetical protein
MPRKPKTSYASEDERIATLQKRIWVFGGLMFCILIFWSIQFGQIRKTYQIVDDFSHNIAAITPLLEAKEAATYRYAFTHMKSREDFKKLVETMRQRAEAVGIQLPRKPIE